MEDGAPTPAVANAEPSRRHVGVRDEDGDRRDGKRPVDVELGELLEQANGDGVLTLNGWNGNLLPSPTVTSRRHTMNSAGRT
jgi:hypothetical protein